MAKRIDSLPARHLGRPALYPWAEWMDGSAWRIQRGEDFEVSGLSMAQHIRERGRRYGVGVRANLLDDDVIEFQFGPETP